MSQDTFTLGQAHKGDILRLSKNGCHWRVIHKDKLHPQFNQVIQLRNDKGTTRTYHNNQPQWKAQVWYV